MVYDPYQAKADKQRRLIAVVLWVVSLSSTFAGFPFPVPLGLFLIILAACFTAEDAAELMSRTAWPFVRRLFMGEGTLTVPDYSEAKAAMLNENWEGAVKALRDYIDADPEDQQARLELALLYDKSMKNHELAAYWYGKVLDLNRKSPAELLAFSELIALLCREGNIEEAKKVSSEMVSRFPLDDATQAARERVKALTAEGVPDQPSA